MWFRTMHTYVGKALSLAAKLFFLCIHKIALATYDIHSWRECKKNLSNSMANQIRLEGKRLSTNVALFFYFESASGDEDFSLKISLVNIG